MRYYFSWILFESKKVKLNYSTQNFNAYWTWSHSYLKSIPIVVDMHLFDSLLQRNSVLPEVSFGQGWRVCQRGLANDPATSGNRWILAAGPGRATLLHYHRSHDVLLPTQHLQERVVMNDAKQKPAGELLLCGGKRRINYIPRAKEKRNLNFIWYRAREQKRGDERFRFRAYRGESRSTRQKK